MGVAVPTAMAATKARAMHAAVRGSPSGTVHVGAPTGPTERCAASVGQGGHTHARTSSMGKQAAKMPQQWRLQRPQPQQQRPPFQAGYRKGRFGPSLRLRKAVGLHPLLEPMRWKRRSQTPERQASRRILCVCVCVRLRVRSSCNPDWSKGLLELILN